MYISFTLFKVRLQLLDLTNGKAGTLVLLKPYLAVLTEALSE